MNKNMQLDIINGNISVDAIIIAGSHIKIDDVKLFALENGAEERFDTYDESRCLANMKFEFLGLPFKFLISFNANNNCDECILRWLDGSAQQRGYEASQEDLSKETKFLGATLASHFGRKTDGKRKGDYIWHFPWGSVSVSYETKSNNCATYIKYKT